MGLTEQIQTTPKWIWIGGGVGFLLLIFLASSRGSQTETVGTPATDIDDILNQLQDAADQFGGQTPTNPKPTTPTTPTTPKPPPPFWGKDVPSWIKTAYTESQVKGLFTKNKINYGGSVNIVDLQALFKKYKINYGTTIDPIDMQALAKKAGLTQGGTPPPTTSTSIWGKDIPSNLRGAVSETKIRSIFRANKMGYGNVINQVDLKALFRKLRINYGTRIDPVDIKYLIQKSNNQVR